MICATTASVMAKNNREFINGYLTIANNNVISAAKRGLNSVMFNFPELITSSSEQPQWLRRTVLRALAEGLLIREEAESIKVDMDQPLTLVERRGHT